MSVSYTKEEVQPLKQFLVKIEGLTDTYLKGELNRLHAPSQLWNETQGLCEEGIVLKAPLSLKHDWPDMIGKKMIFSFVETHAAIKKDSLVVEGCLLINPEYVIQIGDKTFGQWVFCERIPLDESDLFLPIAKLDSFDSSRAAEVNLYDYHIDKGRVAMENEHFPIGTVVYWGKSSYANTNWQGREGFLVKHRSLKAAGDEVLDWKSLNI
jgi:hypothetical protein